MMSGVKSTISLTWRSVMPPDTGMVDAAELLGAVVHAEAAGEQAVAVGILHHHAGPAAARAHRARDDVGPGLDVVAVSNSLDLYTGVLPLSRVVYQQSFVPGNSSPNDQYGHGTHIAGLIAGDGLNSSGPLYTKTFKGIAPGAQRLSTCGCWMRTALYR